MFPGGVGGYLSLKEPKPTIAEWMEKTILYKDSRFARDKMWAFCALNFMSRRINQSSGAFFVNSFFTQGPKNLGDLQAEVALGKSSWVSSITYFSHKVTGSSAYWRARRNEVFSWINYHLEQNHGPPSFFITLSCAEYHWKDIQRLIEDRCEKGEYSPPDFTKGRAAIINEYTIVVQEYFQKRVTIWLDTVGKEVFKIKYHWNRFEFAPSRGQIHVHMLAICDNLEMLKTCSTLKEDKDKLATYLSNWMEETLGFTATFNPEFIDEVDDTHPSTLNFSDILPSDTEKDTANCQRRFQNHKCSGYCMRKRQLTPKKESAESKKRRVCRCGAGVEENYMKCDTPGFIERKEATIVRDIRGFDRVDLPRNNRRITQSSSYLMRGWRGNCDVQLLIYKSPPDNIDPSDVSRVTNYIVSYACKGSESAVEEKKATEAIIQAAEEQDGDHRDVTRMARRILNESTKNRVVSKQEAVCQLAGLSLYSCSESLEQTSLAGNIRLSNENAGRSTFLYKYAYRKSELDMSLDQYFHFIHNEGNKKGKFKIPIYSGAQCEPVNPATAAYARAMLLIHMPWSGTFEVPNDDELLIQKFLKFVQDKNICPISVSTSYTRAGISKGMKEPISSANDMDYDTFTIKADQDHIDLVALASTIYKNYDEEKESCSMNFDYGLDKDWSQRTVEVSCTDYFL